MTAKQCGCACGKRKRSGKPRGTPESIASTAEHTGATLCATEAEALKTALRRRPLNVSEVNKVLKEAVNKIVFDPEAGRLAIHWQHAPERPTEDVPFASRHTRPSMSGWWWGSARQSIEDAGALGGEAMKSEVCREAAAALPNRRKLVWRRTPVRKLALLALLALAACGAKVDPITRWDQEDDQACRAQPTVPYETCRQRRMEYRQALLGAAGAAAGYDAGAQLCATRARRSRASTNRLRAFAVSMYRTA